MGSQGFFDRPRFLQPRRADRPGGGPSPRPAPEGLSQCDHRTFDARPRRPVGKRFYRGGQDQSASDRTEKIAPLLFQEFSTSITRIVGGATLSLWGGRRA